MKKTRQDADMRFWRTRRTAGVAVIILVLGGLAGGLLASQGSGSRGSLPSPPPAPSSSELSNIEAKALEFAVGHGEPHPSAAEVFMTTRQAAVSVTSHGGSIPESFDQGIYFVLLHGSFSSANYDYAPTSPPDTKPYGVALLEIDPATNSLLGSALTDSAPDLSAMGAPVPLDMTSAR